MAKGRKPEIPPERLAEIASDARSGRNWAKEAAYGPGCICGAGARTLAAARGLSSPLADPQGFCQRHPGGSVWVSLPEVWARNREPRKEEDEET